MLRSREGAGHNLVWTLVLTQQEGVQSFMTHIKRLSESRSRSDLTELEGQPACSLGSGWGQGSRETFPGSCMFHMHKAGRAWLSHQHAQTWWSGRKGRGHLQLSTNIKNKSSSLQPSAWAAHSTGLNMPTYCASARIPLRLPVRIPAGLPRLRRTWVAMITPGSWFLFLCDPGLYLTSRDSAITLIPSSIHVMIKMTKEPKHPPYIRNMHLWGWGFSSVSKRLHGPEFSPQPWAGMVIQEICICGRHSKSSMIQGKTAIKTLLLLLVEVGNTS